MAATGHGGSYGGTIAADGGSVATTDHGGSYGGTIAADGGSVATTGYGGSIGGMVVASGHGGSLGGTSNVAGGGRVTAGQGGFTMITGSKTDIATGTGGSPVCAFAVDPLGEVATEARCSCIPLPRAGSTGDPIPGSAPDPPAWGGAGGNAATTTTTTTTTTAAACPSGSGAVVSASVGPDGGTVTMSNSLATARAALTLTIPKGALLETVTIRITETSRSPSRDFAQWSPMYRFEPEELTFAVPATVELPFITETSATDRAQKLYWSSAGNPCTLSALGDSRAYGQSTRASITRLGWGVNGLLMPNDGSTCDPPPKR